MIKWNNIWIYFAIILAAPFGAYGVYSWYQSKFEMLPVIGSERKGLKDEGEHRIADYHLINQDGEVRSTKEWEDKIVVADFFFTTCPTICPKMTASLKKISEVYNDDEVLINSFTVDPERDDPQTLSEYIKKFNLPTQNWDFLTGSKKEIYKLARNSFMVVATDGDGGPTDFIHSENLVLVDTKKRIRGYYDGTSEKEVDQLIIDIKKLKNEK
ncbi:MAG: SCO family protein [Chitinophagaceae bacterium]|nr:SCO family protein [Chitinophagaceae bacterium]